MLSKLKTVWNWLVLSSANPEATSLTVKAALTFVVTYATVFAGLAHVQLPGGQLTTLVDALVQFVQAVLMALSAAVAVYGAARKLWLTVSGKNPVVSSPQPTPGA